MGPKSNGIIKNNFIYVFIKTVIWLAHFFNKISHQTWWPSTSSTYKRTTICMAHVQLLRNTIMCKVTMWMGLCIIGYILDGDNSGTWKTNELQTGRNVRFYGLFKPNLLTFRLNRHYKFSFMGIQLDIISFLYEKRKYTHICNCIRLCVAKKIKRKFNLYANKSYET